jgi:hypothetical protein
MFASEQNLFNGKKKVEKFRLGVDKKDLLSRIINSPQKYWDE